MGFQGIGSAPKYLCLSTDVKPVTGHGIEAGATALETDTSKIFIFNGTAWVQKADLVQLAGSTLDLRGLAANKPAAASVAVGTTYWAVNTGIIEVSTGAAWVVV